MSPPTSPSPVAVTTSSCVTYRTHRRRIHETINGSVSQRSALVYITLEFVFLSLLELFSLPFPVTATLLEGKEEEEEVEKE